MEVVKVNWKNIGLHLLMEKTSGSRPVVVWVFSKLHFISCKQGIFHSPFSLSNAWPEQAITAIAEKCLKNIFLQALFAQTNL